MSARKPEGEIAAVFVEKRASQHERMQEIIRHHQNIKDEMHTVNIERCRAQEELWKENELARRNGRRPDKRVAERYVQACSRADSVRYSAKLFDVPTSSRDEEDKPFEYPKRASIARKPHPPGRVSVNNQFDVLGSEPCNNLPMPRQKQVF